MERRGEDAMAAVLTGGCQCGAARYALASMPIRTSLCHCRMCQKAVGQPFAAYAAVPREAFAWTRGDPATFQGSSAAGRRFCATCGTPLTFLYFHAPTISVTVGSLDQPERAPPTVQVGVESQLSWIPGDFLDPLPRRATDGPNTPEPVRTLINFQHPDHDTAAEWTAPH
jgi:hypothetical protein